MAEKRKFVSRDEPFKKFKNDSILRQSLPKLDSKKDAIIFHQIEVDHYIDSPIPGMPGPQTGTVAIMRMFGVTELGNSVCCHVHGFSPYFFVSLPDNFTENDLEPFKQKLNAAVYADIRSKKDNITETVVQVEIFKGKSLMWYNGDEDTKFAKITVSLPRFIAAAKRLLESTVIYPQIGHFEFSFFEANVDIDMRFMVDRSVEGCSWIEIPPGKWTLRNEMKKLTTCQLEIDIAFDDFITHSPVGDWSKIAPFRIHSFDIECSGRPQIFPDPKVDSVIQISNVVQLYGTQEQIVCNIFTLNTCAPISYAEVRSFKTEQELLDSWSKFVRDLDPDFCTGYNINDFDFWYLIERAKQLKVNNFGYLGRLKNVRTIVSEISNQTKFGMRKIIKFNLEGRIVYDMLPIMRNRFKFRSYGLNNVALEILKEQKEDVHYSIITDLQNGDEQTRRRLAVYCIKDAVLPLRLMNHINSMTNDIEMARVTGVPIKSLLSKGEQVKVVAQLLRESRKSNYLIPTHKVTGNNDEVGYEGATVIEPVRGYYTDPIVTLDFSSLYPSIMMAHNLCYSTLVRNSIVKDKLGLTDDKITSTPAGNLFVKSNVRPGLLPDILQSLLGARKRAKAELKNETNPIKRAVLDARQLALKISANSVYGFTGATVGKLPCLEISGSVTAYGRTMIEQTKQEVEQHYCIANGFKNDAKVIYGDTDSVMINFKLKSLEESMVLGREVAEYISTKFVKPIKLEFEKVYYPYLLINKKRYAGLYFTKPSTYDKMDCKGIETVRRDNCTLVVNVINTCLQKLLIERDPDGAIAFVKQVISDLLCNCIDISQLVITKELSKSDYAAKQAHVELAHKIAKRDPGNAPKLGDRIPYVIVAASKNTPAYQKAEDPIYVLENNIPIDTKYYLENQLAKPLLRIFQPILGDNAESILLRGEHTRTKTVVTSRVGALSAFTIKSETCLGCKSVLPAGQSNQPLCKFCIRNGSVLYQRELAQHSQLEDKYGELFTQCQRCMGSLHEEILCTSRDCPIFYIRTKVRMDLDVSKKKIQRFNNLTI